MSWQHLSLYYSYYSSAEGIQKGVMFPLQQFLMTVATGCDTKKKKVICHGALYWKHHIAAYNFVPSHREAPRTFHHF